MKNRMNCTRTKWRMDELIPFVIYPGTKLLAQQGIESIMDPEQQQRPLPSLLSSSFFYGMFWWINQKSGSFQDGGVLSNVYSGIYAGSNRGAWGYYSDVQSGYSIQYEKCCLLTINWCLMMFIVKCLAVLYFRKIVIYGKGNCGRNNRKKKLLIGIQIKFPRMTPSK